MTVLYRWLLARLGLATPITTYLRRWQHGEPLVWLLASGLAGTWLGRAGDSRGLLWLWAGLMIGVLLGHLYWGGNHHQGDR